MAFPPGSPSPETPPAEQTDYTELAHTLVRDPEFQQLNPAQQVQAFKAVMSQRDPEFGSLNSMQQSHAARQIIDFHAPGLVERGLTAAAGAAKAVGSIVPVVSEAMMGYEAGQTGQPLRPLTQTMVNAMGMETPTSPAGMAAAEAGRGAAEFLALTAAMGPLGKVGQWLAPKVVGGKLAGPLVEKAFGSGLLSEAEQYAGQAAGAAVAQRAIQHGVTTLGIGELLGATHAIERGISGGEQEPLEDFVKTPLGVAVLALPFFGIDHLFAKWGAAKSRDVLNEVISRGQPERFAGLEQDAGKVVEAIRAVSRLPREQAAELAYRAVLNPLDKDSTKIIQAAFSHRPELLSTELGARMLRIQANSILRRPPVVDAADIYQPGTMKLSYTPLVDDTGRGFKAGVTVTEEVNTANKEQFNKLLNAYAKNEIHIDAAYGHPTAMSKFGLSAEPPATHPLPMSPNRLGGPGSPVIGMGHDPFADTPTRTAGGAVLKGKATGPTYELEPQKHWTELDERLQTPEYQEYLQGLLRDGYTSNVPAIIPPRIEGPPAVIPEVEEALMLTRAKQVLSGQNLIIHRDGTPIPVPDVLPYQTTAFEPKDLPNFSTGEFGVGPWEGQEIHSALLRDLDWMAAQRATYQDLEALARVMLGPGEVDQILHDRFPRPFEVGYEQRANMTGKTLRGKADFEIPRDDVFGGQGVSMGDDEGAWLALADRLGLTPQDVNAMIAEKVGYRVVREPDPANPDVFLNNIYPPGTEPLVITPNGLQTMMDSLGTLQNSWVFRNRWSDAPLPGRVVEPTIAEEGIIGEMTGWSPPIPKPPESPNAPADPPVGSVVTAAGQEATVVTASDPIHRVGLQFTDGSIVQAVVNKDGTVDLPPALVGRIQRTHTGVPRQVDINVPGGLEAATEADYQRLIPTLEVGQTVYLNPGSVEGLSKITRAMPAFDYTVTEVVTRTPDGLPELLRLRPAGTVNSAPIEVYSDAIVAAAIEKKAQIGFEPRPKTGTMGDVLTWQGDVDRRLREQRAQHRIGAGNRIGTLEDAELRQEAFKLDLNTRSLHWELDKVDRKFWNEKVLPARNLPQQTMADQYRLFEQERANDTAGAVFTGKYTEDRSMYDPSYKALERKAAKEAAAEREAAIARGEEPPRRSRSESNMIKGCTVGPSGAPWQAVPIGPRPKTPPTPFDQVPPVVQSRFGKIQGPPAPKGVALESVQHLQRENLPATAGMRSTPMEIQERRTKPLSDPVRKRVINSIRKKGVIPDVVKVGKHAYEIEYLGDHKQRLAQALKTGGPRAVDNLLSSAKTMIRAVVPGVREREVDWLRPGGSRKPATEERPVEWTPYSEGQREATPFNTVFGGGRGVEIPYMGASMRPTWERFAERGATGKPPSRSLTPHKMDNSAAAINAWIDANSAKRAVNESGKPPLSLGGQGPEPVLYPPEPPGGWPKKDPSSWLEESGLSAGEVTRASYGAPPGAIGSETNPLGLMPGEAKDPIYRQLHDKAMMANPENLAKYQQILASMRARRRMTNAGKELPEERKGGDRRVAAFQRKLPMPVVHAEHGSGFITELVSGRTKEDAVVRVVFEKDRQVREMVLSGSGLKYVETPKAAKATKAKPTTAEAPTVSSANPKVVVAGTRTFTDTKMAQKGIQEALAKLGVTPGEIVSGGAKGGDAFGEYYGKTNKIPTKVMKADWNKHGRSAGPRRNAQMAQYGDALVAFWDGKSRGTANMIEQMQKVGKPVVVVRIDKGGAVEIPGSKATASKAPATKKAAPKRQAAPAPEDTGTPDESYASYYYDEELD